VIIRLCLLLEASSVCSAAWLLALIHKAVVGFQLDEVYIGTPVECAAAAQKVDDDADDLELYDKTSRVDEVSDDKTSRVDEFSDE
jgi:hypothetical protein